MEDITAVRTYVDDLFRYLETYEINFAKFEPEAFLQTYNGIVAVFQALRQQREQAIVLDEYLLKHVQQAPVTSSDLRQLTVQVLISFFEAEADIDGQSNRSYTYCRGVRAIKQDVPFFEKHLVPLLFQPGSLNGSYRLNGFFLGELARYFNTYGRPLQTGLTPEAFGALGEPLKLLELSRRRLQLGKDLLRDRASLEFQLSSLEAFRKMAQGGSLAGRYLTEWGYLTKGSFWGKVKSALGGLGAKLRGAFSSSRYFRLVLTQRNGAYLFYGLVIVVFLWLAYLVPTYWSGLGEEKLEQMHERVDISRNAGGH